MIRLHVTTCQAENTHETGRAITAYIGQRLGLETEFVLDQPWPERKAALQSGTIQVGWVCGLWYALQAAVPDPPWELLAAPVHRGTRYQNRPVYFSYVTVHQDSLFNHFADLQGSTWVFNEPESLSGNQVMRMALAERGEPLAFFGKVIESGGHLISMAMVTDGRADVAVVDSTVWEYTLLHRPELCRRLRVIDVLGPNPAPPWVISCRVPADLRAEMRSVLLEMPTRPEGNNLLGKSILSQFAPVEDNDYLPLQEKFHRLP